MTRLTGRKVREYRERRGLSAEQLAEKVQEAGFPYTRSQVTNLEANRRTTITVGEILVLAKVLGVPPLLLILPVGQEGVIEVLPDRKVDTWAAAQWFSGEEPFPHWESRDEDGNVIAEVGDAADLEAWEQGAAPIDLYRTHGQVLLRWRTEKKAADIERKGAEHAQTDGERDARLRAAAAKDQLVRQHEDTLWDVRRRMRQHGITPPELPPALRHVETDKSPLHRAIEAHYESQGHATEERE